MDTNLPIRTVYFNSGNGHRPAFAEKMTLQEAFDVVGILTMDRQRKMRPFAFVVDGKMQSQLNA